MASCICAARAVLQAFQRWRRSTSPLGEPRSGKHTPRRRSVNPNGLRAQASEDGEGVLGSRFPDELAARLDLPVQARRERVGVFFRGRADDEVVEAAHGVVPLALELLRQGLRLLAGRALDTDLPRRVAAVELLLFPRVADRLVVPALLVIEPVLDACRVGRAAESAQLGLDHAVGAR